MNLEIKVTNKIVLIKRIFTDFFVHPSSTSVLKINVVNKALFSFRQFSIILFYTFNVFNILFLKRLAYIFKKSFLASGRQLEFTDPF